MYQQTVQIIWNDVKINECDFQYPGYIDSIAYLADRDGGLSRDINGKT